ncbi:acetyl-CoA synthetase-like protein [Backusella circina FSU 941]|nr:acetyl-CoA synthetase-like protein [Backusella circina FSU 941]
MLTDVTHDVSPNEPTSTFDLLFVKNPNNIPDEAPIFITEERTLTFGELSKLIRKCAYNLKEKYNIQKGDIVAVRSNPNIEYPIVMHAVVCAGGSVALVKNSPEDDPVSITEDLQTVNPKVFIIDYKDREISLAAAKRAGIPKSCIVMFGDEHIEGVSKVQDVLLSGSKLAQPCVFTPDELENYPINLLYTSGSTGRRKAVTHTSQIVLRSLKESYPNKRCMDERLLANRPFYFGSSAYTELYASILRGSEVHIVRADTVDEISRAIEKYRITTFSAAPYLVTAMVKEEMTKKYDLSSLRSVLPVGSIMMKKVIESASQLFGVPVVNMYGSTETFTPFNTTPELSLSGAVGRLKPTFESKIVDESGNEVEDGEPGELLVKGPTVTKGYYSNQEATVKAFTSDGFYCSGDIFIRDKDGVFWFLSRNKNLMKYKSTHIYPYEIEKIVMTHPKVADCGVIGVFSQELSTELPRAYVTLVDEKDYMNKESIAHEILVYANRQLHETKSIRAGVVVKERFSRTPTGKILYPVLKREAAMEQI